MKLEYYWFEFRCACLNFHQIVLVPNVLSTLMASWFSWICNYSTVITIWSNGQMHIRNDFQVCHEFPEPYCFLSYFKSRYYSVFIVESTMQFYFMLLHTTTPPFRVNIDPELDFLASLSVWKSKSVYPIRIIFLLNTRACSSLFS